MNGSFLLILFVGLGAWRAWSRSPLFSAKVVLEVAGAVIVGVGAMIAVVVWIADRKQALPASVELGLLFGLIAFATAGMIGAIMRISEGRMPAVPPGAAVIRAQRNKIVPWITDTAVIVAAAAIAAALVPAAWTMLPVALLDFLLLMSASMLVPLYMNAARMDRGTAALIANFWVHWQYKAEHWRAWVAARCAAEKPSSYKVKRIQRRFADAPAEAYLGPVGMMVGREYWPWVTSGSYLVSADVRRDSSGPCLVLNFSMYAGTGSSAAEKWVPLPDDGTADLAGIQNHLRTACPRAVVEIVGKV